MKTWVIFLSICLALFSAIICFAEDQPQISRGDSGMIYGGNPAANKAVRDTVVMIGPWGSAAPVNGQFQNGDGNPDWNGWTHYDVTQTFVSHWQVSDFMAEDLGQAPAPGNLAAWCGDISYPSCGESDVAGGYGNSWSEALQWTATVANPTIGVDVDFSGYANMDTEPGYDFVSIRYAIAGEMMNAVFFDGIHTNELIAASFSLSPDDYQGDGHDQVVIQLRFESDGAWSDEDCLWPTAGAIQIDDITVTLDQGSGQVSDFSDFEGTLGNWESVLNPGVGDFSKIWSYLGDLDYCANNLSPQVAFIDDGVVVPGVGPTLCIDWCYGPGGYIVNTTGGRLGPSEHLHNVVESPVLDWPSVDLEGAILEADVYRHENLGVGSPGMFYTWGVRSTGSSDPADIQIEEWSSRNFLYMGGPDYIRLSHQVSDLLVPGRQYAQVQLALFEIGWAWGFTGNNGTPAPYFDNVNFRAFPFYGPGMASREIDLAQDNFPAIGEVDLVNLGNNSVRFDMARNISTSYELRNDPGDSLVADISSVRAGADLVENPTLHFKIKQNPLFNAYRTSVEFGGASSGESVGIPAEINGVPIVGRWAFDLPDSNFLFPGDVLHYYISASDDNGLEVQTATMPADTTGFSLFDGPMSYHSSFTVRALPSLSGDPQDPGELVSPPILFWNDFANRGGQNEWHGALRNLAFVPGVDYDTYYTNGPSSGVGNGLGGRASVYSIAGYEDILYTCGDLTYATLSDGDFENDPSNDIEVLDSWLRLGGKDIFLTGDDLVSDLTYSGSSSSQFIQDWMGVDFISFSLRTLIHNQSSPKVVAVPGNGVFTDDLGWVAYGGCRFLNTFDAVDADLADGAIKLAEFLDPNDAAGSYTFSAATLKENATYDASVITLPYDFMFINTDPDADKSNASLATRVRLLEQVLWYFGIDNWIGFPVPVPEAEPFSLTSFPNPFNPVTKIQYTMPRAGHLSLKVYNLKGELVKVLIDEKVETGGFAIWDGTDDRGAQVSSGVYFTEARTAGQTVVQKMALVK